MLIVAAPGLLDAETGDPFRRTLRVVFDRLSSDVQYPYDHLDDADARAACLAACLDRKEIVDPSAGWRDPPQGMNDDQHDLDSF